MEFFWNLEFTRLFIENKTKSFLVRNKKSILEIFFNFDMQFSDFIERIPFSPQKSGAFNCIFAVLQNGWNLFGWNSC